MAVKIARIFILLWILFIPVQDSFSQHTSRNDYTGAWEAPESWNPLWPVPLHDIQPYDIFIYGYITASGPLTFSVTSDLRIIDTLVINGNLLLADHSDLTINNGAILIIRGDLYVDKHAEMIANGYLIITGNIYKSGPWGEGSLTSNDNPVHVFVGGSIPFGLTDDNHKYPALDCTSPPTTPYPDSYCSYGNLTDLENDPIFNFFQSTCAVATPTILTVGSTTFCAGGYVTFSSSSGATYLWSTGETTRKINVTTAGSYTVKITNSAGCLSIPSAPEIVTVNAIPATPVITSSGSLTFCSGGSVTLTSSAGTTYLWSTGATTSSINTTSAGSYTIRVTDLNGCQSALSVAAIVIVNSLPVADAGPDITIPNGTSTILNASVSGTDLYTYSWSPADKLVNPSIEDPTTLNLAITTIFTLTATSSITSCSASNSVTINVTGGPLNSILEALPGIVCAGSEVKLYSVVSGGSATYVYSWTSSPAGFTSSARNPLVNPLVTTTYYLAVNDGFSTLNSQVAVTVNEIPATPEITSTDPVTFCYGGSVDLKAGTGSGYLWSNGAASAMINVSESGIYTVNVTSVNGCRSLESVPVIVTENPVPVTPVIIAGGPAIFCEGGNVSLTSSAESSYLWSNGATSASIIVSSSGNYSVKVKNYSGCISASSSAQIVTVNELPATPEISANGPVNFCDGGSVTLTCGEAPAYLWSDGSTTSRIICSESGNFTVKAVSATGCHSENSIEHIVFVDEIPVVSAGFDQELTFFTETQMNADIHPLFTGEWTLISGSGIITDVNSPTAIISKLSLGENKFLWKVKNGTCVSADEVIITVFDLFIPSVITPDGDGVNDYFKLSKMPGLVELIIFNRWGNIEYRNINYLNDWDGRNTRGNELNADTYFYILKFDNYLTRKGSLLIKR
jgi:gliding motility-associated-like protein